MPANDKALDPQDGVIAAAHAAASWARARRAAWTSAPLAVETVPVPGIPVPSVPAQGLPSPEIAAPPTNATPHRRAVASPLLRRLARGTIAGALAAAEVIGGRALWRALPALPAATSAPEPTVPAAGKATGSLHVISTPAGARVLVDGRTRGVTPVELTDLSPGRHEVALQSDAGSVKRTVTVAANATVTLEEAIFSGFVTVYAPFDVTVSEGGRVLRADDRQQIMLRPGAHDLRISNRALDYEAVRRVEIKPGEATTLQLAPAPSPLTVTAAEAAEVWLDGTRLGETPLTAAVPLGIHEVLVKRAAGGERRYTVTIGARPVTLAVDFTGR